MRLETGYDPPLPGHCAARSPESGAQLGRMVGVVVEDCHATDASHQLEAPQSTCEGANSRQEFVMVNPQQGADAVDGSSVGDVVAPGNLEFDATPGGPVDEGGRGRRARQVEVDELDLCLLRLTVGDHLDRSGALQANRQLGRPRIIDIGDDIAHLGAGCHRDEAIEVCLRGAPVVEVVSFHIGDDDDLAGVLQEGAVGLVSLDDEDLPPTQVGRLSGGCQR